MKSGDLSGMYGFCKKLRPASPGAFLDSIAYPSLYLILLALLLSIWHTLVTQSFSPKALVCFLFLSGFSLVYGRLFLKLLPPLSGINPNLTIQFLCGYFVLDTLGFMMSFVTQFTIAGNILILCACGILVLLICQEREAAKHDKAGYFLEILCLLLSGIGATLWCVDSLNPVVANGQSIIFQTWSDSFFHSREISIFAQSHGLRTISDIQMSGAPATIYHYASYVIPAAIASTTHTSAYEVFASFYVPFGILLTGLAAFSLTSAIWGRWPGIAGTVALILLPDAWQQGFQNKFMSYNFLQQANPGGLYGVALITIAWILVLDGCKTGKPMTVFFGYAIAMAGMAYKAQLFVANAFLIMIYPCLFFTGLKIKRRIVIGIILVTLFVYVVHLSQHFSFMPTLRLDGSGTKHYAYIIMASYDRGIFRHFFYKELTGLPSLPFDVSVAFMVMISSFGLWIISFSVFLYLQGKKAHRADRWFPVFVITNYLIMAVGLAVDERKIGMSEEFLHRPLVWAYFVTVAWTGAAIYAFLAGNGPPRKGIARTATVILILLCLLIPLTFAQNIQTMPAWPGYQDYESFNTFPAGFVKACLYIRKHSNVTDIIQDSENDPRLMVTAMAERQDFAVYNENGGEFRAPEGLVDRIKNLAEFKQMTNESDLIEFARKNHISWYLLQPKTAVAWPASLLKQSVFNSEGYRVYHFSS